MVEEVEQLSAVIGGLLDRGFWALSDAEVVDTLRAVSTQIDRLAVARAALVREVDARALHVSGGSTSVATFLRDHLRISVRTGHRLAALGRLFDHRPGLPDAVGAGRATIEQAAAIGDALDDLPSDVGDVVRDKAEAMLLDHADRFEPALLHRLGERVLEHVAPEVAEAALKVKLEADDRRGQVGRQLTLTPGRDGRTRLSGWLDTEAAALVTAAIDPLARPVPGVAGDPDLRTPAQRRADALAEVCRLALASGELPDCGGERPQLTVTVPYDPLTRQLGAGQLDTGGVLSPATVRRIACDAELIPAVLGTDSAVLDLGRSRRLFVGSARRALVLRDRGCAFPGCDRPPRWCHAHHMRRWTHGGKTDVRNGVLLCGHHHRLIHHSDWSVRPGADGRPEFIPPAYVDPARRPMRNLYHRRT